MITKELIVDKILDHLNGDLSEDELVNWAEYAYITLSSDDADEPAEDTIMEMLDYIGAGDEDGFPLTWTILSGFLEELGARVSVSADIE